MVYLSGAAQRILKLLLLSLLLLSCAPAAQLPKLSPDAVILAFGDSLTYGTGVKKEQAYPSILTALTGYEVVNAGIPGEVTKEGLARLPALLDEVHPELVIICHGGNDMLRRQSMGAAARNLRAMIELAQGQGIAVVLIAVPDLGVFLSPPSFYRDLGATLKVPVEEDVISEILANPGLKSDQIHPNAEGYRMIAEAVYQRMLEAGAL